METDRKEKIEWWRKYNGENVGTVLLWAGYICTYCAVEQSTSYLIAFITVVSVIGFPVTGKGVVDKLIPEPSIIDILTPRKSPCPPSETKSHLNLNSNPIQLDLDIKNTEFSGMWEKSKMVDMGGVLQAMGAPYFQRQLAQTVSMTHTYFIDKEKSTCRFIEKGGPIYSDNSFELGAIARRVEMRQPDPIAHFEERWWFEGPDKLRRTRLKQPNEEFLVSYTITLSPGGQTLVMDFEVTKPNDPEAKAAIGSIAFSYKGPAKDYFNRK